MLRSLYRGGQRLVGRVLQRTADQRTADIMRLLSNVPLFQELQQTALHELADITHQRTYRRDEFLYYENDPGMGLYVVEQGTVRLLMGDAEGTLQELRKLGTGQVFGELSLLDSFKRMETVQAVTETTVLGFFRPDLTMLSMRNPQVGAQVTAVLARYLAHRQVELINMISSEAGPVQARHMLMEASTTVHEDAAGRPTNRQ
ncbi:MAG: cyclic nucleotide-binding domain-containing protein [Bacteroidetes bacterium]|nr:cyclic nucleotide-binding domain-containing protein [Bacteroidota bacterium]